MYSIGRIVNHDLADHLRVLRQRNVTRKVRKHAMPIVVKDKGVLRSLVEEHLGGVQNRRLLVWSLLNAEEYLTEVPL